MENLYCNDSWQIGTDLEKCGFVTENFLKNRWYFSKLCIQLKRNEEGFFTIIFI